MSQVYNQLPSVLSERKPTLELNMPWRISHIDTKTGAHEFFCGFIDWTPWIWACVELFPRVKTLTITHNWRGIIDTLFQLKCHLQADMYGPAEVGAINTEPRKWRIVYQTAGSDTRIMKLFLVGKDNNERKGRLVKIQCRVLSTEDLIHYGWPNYGWLDTES